MVSQNAFCASGHTRKIKCSKTFDLPGVATYRCIRKELSLIQKELPQSSFKELPRLLPTTVCRSSIPTFSPVIPFGKVLPTHAAACHIYSHMVSQNAFCASGHTRKIKCSKTFDLPGVATYRCIRKELSLIQKELPQSSFKELPRLLPTTVCRSSIPTFSPVIPFGKILPTHAACHIYSHMVSQNAFCASGHTRKIKCQHLIFRVWPLTAVSKRSLV